MDIYKRIIIKTLAFVALVSLFITLVPLLDALEGVTFLALLTIVFSLGMEFGSMTNNYKF